MQRASHARRYHRVNAAQQTILEQAACHLCRPDQGGQQQCGRQRQALRLQQTGQVRGHGGANEPGDGKDQGQQRAGAAGAGLA